VVTVFTQSARQRIDLGLEDLRVGDLGVAVFA